MPENVAQFANAKYFSLETFRKTGVGVKTPVWFAADPESTAGMARFYVYTLPDSGKVKRIRNNASVRINPCTMRGDLRGEWVNAQARFCEGEEAGKGQRLLTQKYPSKRIGDLFSRLMGRKQCVLAIEVS